MSKISKKRRSRRQAKMALGGKFEIRHRSKSGRTGSVRSHQLKGRRAK